MARSIKAGSTARVYYVIQSGYDSHAVQLPTQAQLLREFAGGVKAFLDDLAAAKLADRVVLMAFSEFGRRPEENGSLGTDHGTAGPLFLAGPSVKPGLFGKTPLLGDLEDGNSEVVDRLPKRLRDAAHQLAQPARPGNPGTILRHVAGVREEQAVGSLKSRASCGCSGATTDN